MVCVLHLVFCYLLVFHHHVLADWNEGDDDPGIRRLYYLVICNINLNYLCYY